MLFHFFWFRNCLGFLGSCALIGLRGSGGHFFDDEIESIQIELAIALGQYPSDASFQALVRSLDNRSLALNLAAADSLRVLGSF